MFKYGGSETCPERQEHRHHKGYPSVVGCSRVGCMQKVGPILTLMGNNTEQWQEDTEAHLP